MNVNRFTRALREIADAIDEGEEAKAPPPPASRPRSVRRIVAPPPPPEIDEVTCARAKRLLKKKGFSGGDE